MGKLVERKSKLLVQTENTLYDRGKPREIVVELKPDYMLMRLKGTRAVYPLSYSTAFNQAVRNDLARKRLEKLQAKKGKK